MQCFISSIGKKPRCPGGRQRAALKLTLRCCNIIAHLGLDPEDQNLTYSVDHLNRAVLVRVSNLRTTSNGELYAVCNTWVFLGYDLFFCSNS